MQLKLLKEHKTGIFLFAMTLITTVLYLNHFDNVFHFDDSHAILENNAIRKIDPISSFFTDGSTSSNLAQNQTYRPIVTLSLALDYWVAGGYSVFYFHLTNFIVFILQGYLLFFFLLKISNTIYTSKHNFYFTAIGTFFYMIHPVMAETVNYIIARSDIFSTFFVLCAFVYYQYSQTAKKYYLYCIPLILGALSKPTAIMFAPLLYCYIFLFENDGKSVSLTNSVNALKKAFPAILVCLVLYFLHRRMLPETYATGGGSLFNYLITQPLVIAYYFFSFGFPVHLSADTDWTPLSSIWTVQFWIGFLFIIGLIALLIFSIKKKKYYPIAFGISWFFIALAPTSSFIPLAEVMNDHRMFFPYVGLILILIAFIHILYQKFHIKTQTIFITASMLTIIYTFGTFKRNQVWDNDESLWFDVVQKSPKNGRGLMNYGLSQMSKGKYDIAEEYFLKALKYTPYYYTLHINLGVLYNAKGNKTKAENFFQKAIQYGHNYYLPYYFYGDYLKNNKRIEASNKNLEIAQKLAPNHLQTKLFLMENYSTLEDWSKLENIANETLEIDPKNEKAISYLVASKNKVSKLEIEEQLLEKSTSTESLLALSHKYYIKKKFNKSILIAQKALQINPNLAAAYNNICSSYNQLANFEAAEKACQKAIKLQSDFLLAKNNLDNVTNRKTKLENLKNSVKEKKRLNDYINITLLLFNYTKYEEAIKYAQQGLVHFPKSIILHNNLCATYNQLKKWKKGAEIGKKGLVLDPENQLLKNNYNWALQNLK